MGFIKHSNFNHPNSHQNTINSHNQRLNKALIPLERILKPLDQDLILITAYKIKNKIKNRIGVKELDSLGKNDRSEAVLRSLILEKEERSWPKEARGREELLLFPREPKEHSVLMRPQVPYI